MTGAIIPADQWPEDAHLHTWDSNGLGNWLRPSYGAWHHWASDIPLPPGHDWRVPVMRPAAVPAIDRDRLLSALERAAAAETELARLRDQQQFPAIDLEQFRAALDHALLSIQSEEKRADIDRLLALIDGQANVRSSSEHSEPALQRPLIARPLAEWHEDDGPAMWWAWCGSDWAGEPAWCGTPNDSDWPGYHTHWTPHPAWPMQPTKGEGVQP